ncbi:MAG TPA: hypothetical protein VMS09_05930 [Paenibacillus sp.]|uniref:hypothetical protein n=1 Tax=Paenibacillus sp. TaxID=58172 RepID=UPI0028D3F14D|nr:hypothetical protein [Paenibacillus sp.]HUC91558.1 hypothetical protein [Paenibacillus sp.]
MTVVYQSPCFDVELIVKKLEEDGLSYQVSIRSTKNPLGTGNMLGAYPTEEEAVRKTGTLCSFYSKARENGYYLRSGSFVKPGRNDIPVSMVLDGDMTGEQLDSLVTH